MARSKTYTSFSSRINGREEDRLDELLDFYGVSKNRMAKVLINNEYERLERKGLI